MKRGERDQSYLNRRQFIGQAGAMAGISFLPCGLGMLCASESEFEPHPRRKIMVNGRQMLTVDIHCHSYVHDVWPLIRESGQVPYLEGLVESAMRKRLELSNVEFRLQQMNEQGIDVQAVSLHVGQYHHWADYDLAREIIDIQNRKIAELCDLHSDRFVGLGAVALQHPSLAAEQMRFAVKELDMRGFMITASIGNKELSDPIFHPFWRAAEELGIVIFIHPRGFEQGQERFEGNGRLNNVIGNPLETTTALSHLIFEGTLDRFPGLKICAAHGGGYLPSYSGRSDHCVQHYPRLCEPVENLPSYYLRNRLFFDSLVYTDEGLRHLVEVVGADRVVIGTDFPFEMGNSKGIDHVLGLSGLTDQEMELILGGTAAKLLRINPAV